MGGVVLGTERWGVSPSQVHRFSDNENLWWFCLPYDGDEVKVLLAGHLDRPDPAWLDLAERVAARIHAFVAEARSYLRAFVDPGRFGSPGEWDLDSLEFGRRQDPRVGVLAGHRQPVDVFLRLDEDTYGVWSVREAAARELLRSEGKETTRWTSASNSSTGSGSSEGPAFFVVASTTWTFTV